MLQSDAQPAEMARQSDNCGNVLTTRAGSSAPRYLLHWPTGKSWCDCGYGQQGQAIWCTASLQAAPRGQSSLLVLQGISWHGAGVPNKLITIKRFHGVAKGAAKRRLRHSENFLDSLTTMAPRCHNSYSTDLLDACSGRQGSGATFHSKEVEQHHLQEHLRSAAARTTSSPRNCQRHLSLLCCKCLCRIAGGLGGQSPKHTQNCDATVGWGKGSSARACSGALSPCCCIVLQYEDNAMIAGKKRAPVCSKGSLWMRNAAANNRCSISCQLSRQC